MTLDFNIQVQRLRQLGVILSPEEHVLLQAALPVVRCEYGLDGLCYIGRIKHQKGSYHVLIGLDRVGTQQFICSSDCIKWTMLPRLSAVEEEELQTIGFGLECKIPFFGNLEKKLPKKMPEPVEEEPEPEPEPEPEEPKGEEGEEKEEGEGAKKPKEPVEKLPKPKPLQLREKHRLSLVMRHIHRENDIVLLEAYIKQNGQQAFKTSCRGASKASLDKLSLKSDYQKYLDGKIEESQVRTLDKLRLYACYFDPLSNCTVVKHLRFPGLLWFAYQQTLVWGGFYDGDGIAY